MFPLGTVLFPSAFLPLHVFEPRYRAMVQHCLDGEQEFGVVLIERGSEVGGGDVRTLVGTVARIIEAQQLDDGRWVLGTVGTHRIRVRGWLAEDPFPRAEVERWDDEDTPGLDLDLEHLYQHAVARLRRVLALKAELAEPAVDATVELSADPVLGSYQCAAVAPLGPADQQVLLAASGAGPRLSLLTRLLGEEEQYLRARLTL